MAVLLVGGACGAAAARLLRVPMWPLIGALVGAAVVHNLVGGSGLVPGWWRVVAQVLVGAAVGAGIAPGVFRQFRSVLLPGLLAVVSIIGLGIGAGIGIAVVARVDLVTAVFGMVPGGVGEMVAAATALHAQAPVVAGMHVTRLVVVLSTLPLLVRLARRLSERRDDDA